MKLSFSCDLKIYNLSAGKSLPEWISNKKRRRLEQRDSDLRRRVQLLQDLEMPSVSRAMGLSTNNQYFFVAGSYKPIVKCFDFNELSLKFERGLDSDVIKMIVLSEDFSKLVLLEEDRYVEFHARYGTHFRLRIPNFGRDIAFSKEISELYIVGCHGEIFRLNIEQGRFMEPFVSQSSSLNCCQLNEEHQLFVCGTSDCLVEAWDHRDRKRVSTLDCARNNGISLEFDFDTQLPPEVTSLKFKDALHLAVGLSSGNVLLYDIRSSKPYLMKNHQFSQPITCIDFDREQNLVLSMDSRVLKIWHENDGRPFTSIEPGKDLNEFLRFPDSGMIFFANDDQKILQFFIPSLGPAPKWCSYLESITEELEESNSFNFYDDFKFVTKSQMEDLGLSSLIGTNSVRACMHGYFIDMGAYKRAKESSQMSALENLKRKKMKERLEEERQTNFIRADNTKLPSVNKELAQRLQSELSILGPDGKSPDQPKKARIASDLLADERFSDLFKNPEFEIDMRSDQFKQMEPLKKKQKTNRCHQT